MKGIAPSIGRIAAEEKAVEIARGKRQRLIDTIAGLVSIPSENRPPLGSERLCQEFVAARLRELGLPARTYDLHEVPGLSSHPEYRKGREYRERPNVAGTWAGSGGGRSLLLTGHIDTVPRGSETWSRDPFSPTVEGNRLYGLGSNDMKGGAAAMLVAVEVLREAGICLRGNLLFETIVDEEFGGVNGTLAGRLVGHNADAAVICEPSQHAVCPAQTGGRTVHIRTRAGGGGILLGRGTGGGNAEPVRYLLERIEEFARKRREVAPDHPLYLAKDDAVPVWVTKIASGGWGTGEPITLPVSHKLEIYWQTMPGETEEKVTSEFYEWFDETVAARPDLFPLKPDVQFPIRWLPGSAISADNDLVTGLEGAFEDTVGSRPVVQGIGGPCDMFVFHQHFNTPAVLFGPRGGNTHAPDEWVDIDSTVAVVEALVRFICRWCG